MITTPKLGCLNSGMSHISIWIHLNEHAAVSKIFPHFKYNNTPSANQGYFGKSADDSAYPAASISNWQSPTMNPNQSLPGTATSSASGGRPDSETLPSTSTPTRQQTIPPTSPPAGSFTSRRPTQRPSQRTSFAGGTTPLPLNLAATHPLEPLESRQQRASQAGPYSRAPTTPNRMPPQPGTRPNSMTPQPLNLRVNPQPPQPSPAPGAPGPFQRGPHGGAPLATGAELLDPNNAKFPVTNYVKWVQQEMAQGRIPPPPPDETSAQEKHRHNVVGVVAYEERNERNLLEAQRRQDENNAEADRRQQENNALADYRAIWVNEYNRQTAMKASRNTVNGNRITAFVVTAITIVATYTSRLIGTGASGSSGNPGNSASTQAMAMAANSGTGPYVGAPSRNVKRYNAGAVGGTIEENGVPHLPGWKRPDGEIQDPNGELGLDGEPYYHDSTYGMGEMPQLETPDPGIHDGLATSTGRPMGMPKAKRFRVPPQTTGAEGGY